ncbi:hypothetical protein GCM10019016_088590 [Streptomyces prasinosporus]|uniref:Acyltransferase n=1 Tax=Streptomyces prasinosporus TaxID=68256 RepID=A0ABP6U2R7_9ACTN
MTRYGSLRRILVDHLLRPAGRALVALGAIHLGGLWYPPLGPDDRFDPFRPW